MSIINRLSSAWNAFRDSNKKDVYPSYQVTSSYNPDRQSGYYSVKDRGLITSIYNRIALDCASVPIRHVRTDIEGRYLEDINDSIDERISVSANIDQTGQAFVQDIIYSVLEEGYVAVCPIDTEIDIDSEKANQAYKILSMRCGRIVTWAPDSVQVNLYNDRTGEKKDVWFKKTSVAIIENPFYSVMNEPNSTLKRLLHKMALLDQIDSENATGKLDLIIQLPYVVKSEARKKQASLRREEIISQLTESKYGIAYTDGTEKIVQLNRSIENNLPGQIKDLYEQLYNQLNMDPSILNGTANEETMTNYQARVIVPILNSLVMEFNRKFLTRTAMTQGHTFMYFQDYFKLVPVTKLATIADTFSRNAILSSNEIRQIIGFKPSTDAEADELRNRNLYPAEADPTMAKRPAEESTNDGYTDDDYGFH